MTSALANSLVSIRKPQIHYLSVLLLPHQVIIPKISKALTGADRKDLMRKLPKFIYDDEKALERMRKILTDKIAQLNSATDDVSSQLCADDEPNGVAVTPDELEVST